MTMLCRYLSAHWSMLGHKEIRGSRARYSLQIVPICALGYVLTIILLGPERSIGGVFLLMWLYGTFWVYDDVLLYGAAKDDGRVEIARSIKINAIGAWFTINVPYTAYAINAACSCN